MNRLKTKLLYHKAHSQSSESWAVFLICVGFGLCFLLSMPHPGLAKNTKVPICHIPPDDPDNAHEIMISEKAVGAHLAHGDHISFFRDDLSDDRAACQFTTGATPEETLGIAPQSAAAIPITHVVIVMNENRSFDHYFATLHETHPDVEAVPADYSNPDPKGGPPRTPFHLESACLPTDIPHGWCQMVEAWNEGAMDGFVRVAVEDIPAGVCYDGEPRTTGMDDSGYNAIGFYDKNDLPFYHWLARTFAFADRYFGSVLGPTWPNRAVLYTGTTLGYKSTHSKYKPELVEGKPTIFSVLNAAGISWGVFTNGAPRQNLLGWKEGDPGVKSYPEFLNQLANGTLPSVSFVDPKIFGEADEHPSNKDGINKGESFSRTIYTTAVQSPLWPSLAVFYTYDESGGLFDHVPPPTACQIEEEPDNGAQVGIRVPLFVVSPWARPGYVSHQTHEHASLLRFIELLFNLPALANRDANADALLDMFNFSCQPPMLHAPTDPPEVGMIPTKYCIK